MSAQPQQHPNSQNTPNASQSFDQKSKTRSCESCRHLKVRCLASPDDTPAAVSGQCQRCAKTGRQCMFTAPSRTRRRKRTDVRVKELEREVKALSELLRGGVAGLLKPGVEFRELPDQGDGATEPMEGVEKAGEKIPLQRVVQTGRKNMLDTLIEHKSDAAPTDVGQNEGMTPPPPYSNGGRSVSEPVSFQSGDVIDRGLLSLQDATELFNRFNEEMAEHFPIIVFPQGTIANSVRVLKPTLFRAILAAAAGPSGFGPQLSKTLNSEILQIYANRIFIKGEKKLELIQALLVTIVWYYPPNDFEDLKFYQYIHVASTMAIDMGLGEKSRIRDSGAFKEGVVDSESIESRRVLLSCYLLCSSVSLGFRRPSMLRFSNWMAESLKELETSPDAAPTDKRLAAWVKLQRIMEASSSAFSTDDPSAGITLADPRIQLTLKSFEKQLENWKFNLPSNIMNETLLINYHFHNAMLHEIALHTFHSIEEFIPPFTLDRIRPSHSATLTPSHVYSLVTCLSSAHSLLSTLLSMSISSLRASPIINFVRMSYAVVILVKLFFLASEPNGALGHILEPESVKVVWYLEQLVPKMAEVAGKGGEMCRAGGKFGMILVKLGEWYRTQRVRELEREVSGEGMVDDELIEPLRHLDLAMEGSHGSTCLVAGASNPENERLSQEPKEQSSDGRDTREMNGATDHGQQNRLTGSTMSFPLSQKSFDFDPFNLFDDDLAATTLPEPITSAPAVSANTYAATSAFPSNTPPTAPTISLDAPNLSMSIPMDIEFSGAENMGDSDEWMQKFMAEFGGINGDSGYGQGFY